MCNGTCSKMIQFKEIMKPQNNMWASYCLFSPSIHLFDFFFSINWFLIPHFRYKISENQVKYPTTSSQGDVFKCWVLSNQHKKRTTLFLLPSDSWNHVWKWRTNPAHLITWWWLDLHVRWQSFRSTASCYMFPWSNVKQRPVCLDSTSIDSVNKLPPSEDYISRHTHTANPHRLVSLCCLKAARS